MGYNVCLIAFHFVFLFKTNKLKEVFLSNHNKTKDVGGNKLGGGFTASRHPSSSSLISHLQIKWINVTNVQRKRPRHGGPEEAKEEGKEADENIDGNRKGRNSSKTEKEK